MLRIDRCDRCGKPIEGPARKLWTGERVGKNWKTGEFIRYYCGSCMKAVKRAVEACEKEGRR